MIICYYLIYDILGILLQVSAYSSLLHSGRVNEDEEKKMNQETKEPLFTNLFGGFPATLDYIFHTGIADIITELLPGFNFVTYQNTLNV